MDRPAELGGDAPPWPGAPRPGDVWAALSYAAAGDVDALRVLVARDERLACVEFEGTRPLHLAVREGRGAVLRFLLEAGADPRDVTARGDDLVTVARDRGLEAIAAALRAAGAEASARPSVEERWRAAFAPLDLALWTGPFWNVRGDLAEARRLAGEEPDAVVAAALGDAQRVRALLDEDPARANRARATGKRPLSAAVEFRQSGIARLLLEHGADPNLPEGAMAPRGSALHAAARLGDAALVEALLAHGADPNAWIDSSGSATYAAATPELRARLLAAGGRLSPYDLVWLGADEEALRAVAADPAAAHAGCGTVFAAACTLGKSALVQRLLDAGARVPAQVNGCRSYLLERPELLARLLESGMRADLPDWQGATLLHEACARDRRGRPRPARVACAELLLTAGATLEARDDDLRSRPMAWAARAGLADMVALLLERGAAPVHPGDAPWTTPRAWATRRGHADVSALLAAG
jgi:ankyrin repeat protein